MGPIVASWMASQERLATRREGGIFPCRHVHIIMICLEWRRAALSDFFRVHQALEQAVGAPQERKDQRSAPCAGVVGSLHATDMDFGRSLLMDDVSRAESAIWRLAEGGCKGKLRENAGGRWRLAKKHKGRRPGTMGTLSPLGQNIYAFRSFGVVEHIPA